MLAALRTSLQQRGCHALAVALILIGAAALRFPSLDDNPNGFFCDEASVGFDAVSLLETGRDQYGVWLPGYARSFGDYDEASYRYLTIPFVATLGRTIEAVRLPAALAGLATVLLVTLYAGAAFGRTAGWLAGVFLALSPWHVHFSRIGFRAALLPLMFVGWLYFLSRPERRPRDIVYASIFGGLALWTYSPARVVVPIFALIVAAAYGREAWEQSRRATVAGIAIFAAVLACCASFWITPQGMARAGGLVTSSFGTFAEHYVTYFSPSFLFGEGDPNLRHSIRGWGELQPIELLALPFGLFVAFTRRRREHFLLLAWLLLAPVPAALTEPNQALRAILMAPAYACLSGIGAASVIESGRRLHHRLALASVTLAPLLAGGVLFARAYFVEYPAYSSGNWQWGLREVMAELKRTDRDCHVVTSRLFLPHIFVLYFGDVAPRDFQSSPIEGITQQDMLYDRYDIGPWRIRPLATGVVDSRECSFVGLGEEMGRISSMPGYEPVTALYGPNGEYYFQIFQFRDVPEQP